jgi:hypothetical protein
MNLYYKEGLYGVLHILDSEDVYPTWKTTYRIVAKPCQGIPVTTVL